MNRAFMRTVGGALFTVVVVSACARAAEPFARVAAPTGKAWTPAERWKTETIDGRQVCRIISGNAYPRAPLTGDAPTAGNVMVKVTYHSKGGDYFFIGLGAWGAPVQQISPQKAGWQTGQVVFPARSLNISRNAEGIGLYVRMGGKTGPAIEKIELLVATRAETLECFRRYVREATAAAWKMSKSPSLKYIDDYDDKEPLAPTAADEKRGAIPFLRSYLKYVYPASVPIQAERAVRGRVRMTPGEFEPFQFAVKALKDLPAARVHFIGKLPKGLSGELVSVECVPTRTKGGSRSKNWHVQPYRLWPREVFPTCAVKKGDAQAWWVIFKAGDALKPGTYPVDVAVADGSSRVATFKLQVEVLPFVLPKKLDRAFLLCDARAVWDEALLKDLGEHGCNGLNAFNSFQPVKDGEVDFTVWDEYFARLKKHGLDYAYFWYLGNPNSGNAVLGGVGKENFVKLLTGLNQRVKDGRYPKVFALAIDEAVTNKRAFKQFQELSAMLRQHAPALKCQGTSLASHSYAKRYKGLIDVLACNGSFAANSKWCRQQGIVFTMYGYVAARVSANNTRSLYGFHSWQHQAGGTNGWALRWNNGNAYNDLDAGVSDWGILLPSWVGKPISTPAWEGYREGFDDQRYLHVLEGLAKAGKASDALLKEIRAKGVGEMNVWAEKVVGDSLFGVALKNATNLQIARERVIEEILKAMKAK